MKNKIIKVLLYILTVVVLSIPFGGFVNTLLKNNFQFKFSISIFFGKESFLIASVIIVIFLLIPLFLLGKRYMTRNHSSVDKITKSKSNLLGSSRFLEQKELNKIYPVVALHKEDYKAGFIVNTFFKKDGRLYGNMSYDRHNLVVGTTGVGKTTYFLEPTIQFIANSNNQPSLVISDPKGELFEKESGVLEKKGWDIKKLDLRNPEKSLRYNPLENVYLDYQKQLNAFRNVNQHNEILSEYLLSHKDINTELIDDINTDYWFEYENVAYDNLETVKNAVEQTRRTIISELKDTIKQIASCIVPQEKHGEEIWTEGARSLIASIIWGLLEDSEIEELNITKEKVNLNQVLHILSSDAEYLTDFINNRPATSNSKNLGSQYANNSAEGMKDSFKGMAITFLNRLSGLEYLLGKNEFDFTTFTNKPTAIFLIIPDETDTRYSVATMFISLLYSSLTKEASLLPNTKLKREVMFLLDEFANLPKFEHISNWVSISRSRGIYFLLIIQSLGQLYGRYGRDMTATIQTQCQLNIYLGTTDKDTQEYYQYLLGNETVRQNSVSAKTTTGEATSASENLTGKPLVRTDELARIKKGEAYVTAFQEYPAKTTLIPIFYSSMPTYKGCKSEFLIEKQSMQSFKPENFDLSALSYDISKRYALFNQYHISPEISQEKNLEDKLIDLLEPIQTSKKQAIIKAFKDDKYNLVISNLKELERNGTIHSAETIIEELKSLKK